MLDQQASLLDVKAEKLNHFSFLDLSKRVYPLKRSVLFSAKTPDMSGAKQLMMHENKNYSDD